MTDKAQGAPERIWAERSPISGEEWWTAEPTSLGIEYMQPYILATPAALAASPEVAALIAAAILDAQLRCMERGRIDTPNEIRTAAALRGEKEPK